MIGKLDKAMQFNEAALSLRGARQQILASNIANADTPNYKARDIDFGQALAAALSQSPDSKSTQGPATANTPLLYRQPQQASIDGNTVEMDIERNQFTDNAIRYEASLTLISGQIKSLLSAIQG